MNPGSENVQTEEEAVERMLTDIDALPGARYLSAVFRLHPCGVHGSAFDPVRGETVYSGFDLFFFTRLREHVRMNLLDSHLRQLARAWSGKWNTRVFFHPVCPESAVPELHDTLFLQMLKRDGILLRGSGEFLDLVPELPADRLQKTEPLHHIAVAGLNLLSSIHRLNDNNLSIADILRAKLLLSHSAMRSVDALLLAEKKYDFRLEERIRNLKRIIGEKTVSVFDPVPMLHSYESAAAFMRNPHFLPFEVVAGEMERTLDLWRPVFLYITMLLCNTRNIFTETQAVHQLILHKDEWTTTPAAERIITNFPEICRIFRMRFPTGEGPQVILTGGQLNYRTGLLEGSALRRSLENYQADIGFSSAFGMDETGLLDISDECSEQIALMLEKSAVRVVLADHTKFGRKSFCRCLPWEKIDILITVFDPENHEYYKAVRECGVRIIFADAGNDKLKEK